MYTVTAVAKDRPKAEGPPAIQYGIEYRDVFPPPAVARVDALPEEHRVRLSWTAVEARDLAEYRIFRSEGDAAPALLAKTPADRTEFDDETVSPGRTYRYTVMAVDKNGNVGVASPEAVAKPFE